MPSRVIVTAILNFPCHFGFPLPSQISPVIAHLSCHRKFVLSSRIMSCHRGICPVNPISSLSSRTERGITMRWRDGCGREKDMGEISLSVRNDKRERLRIMSCHRGFVLSSRIMSCHRGLCLVIAEFVLSIRFFPCHPERREGSQCNGLMVVVEKRIWERFLSSFEMTRGGDVLSINR
jgi:hypothetical protein